MVYGATQIQDPSAMDSLLGGSKPVVLIVENETALLTMLRHDLEQQGCRVEEAMDGEGAMSRITDSRPDLVLMGGMPPNVSGAEVCRHIRQRHAASNLPVIMLTAHTDDQDVVRALDAGADVCMTRPLNSEIFLARMRSLLRRVRTIAERPMLSFHDLTMDVAAHRVQRNGRTVHLGPTEFRLLAFLMQYPKRVFCRGEILNAVWGYDIHVAERTIDVHVRRLRQAINGADEIDLVQTVTKAGYRLHWDPH
jgi:two-component system, OmpR family, phosphate regulon response regulator PhoB